MSHSLLVISEYDRYLKCVFGDYMKLPPEDKRKSHHIEYLNLNLSYKAYNNQ